MHEFRSCHSDPAKGGRRISCACQVQSCTWRMQDWNNGFGKLTTGFRDPSWWNLSRWKSGLLRM